MKFPIFSFPALKEKFSSHISSFLLEKSPCDQRLSPLRRRSSSLRPVLSGWFCRPGDRSPFFAPGSSRYFIRLRKLGTQLPGGRKTSCRKCFHQELASYNAYFAKDTQEKILYLTFDCGYENGNTPLLLNALKKHNVKATFFVVGNFIRDNGDLIKEMVRGRAHCRKSYLSHPDMSGISSE